MVNFPPQRIAPYFQMQRFSVATVVGDTVAVGSDPNRVLLVILTAGQNGDVQVAPYAMSGVDQGVLVDQSLDSQLKFDYRTWGASVGLEWHVFAGMAAIELRGYTVSYLPQG